VTAPLRIAVAGLGTVGAGLIRLIAKNGEQMALRTGRPVDIVAVSARDRGRDRGVDIAGFDWFDDAAAMATGAAADVVVELIGGEDGVAKAVVENALANGRHVVTANKALIARHGAALARLADDNGVALAFEAAVAGGIPIVKALREGMAGNDLGRVFGILNGTCNYILTDMRETGRPFEAVLGEAQAQGYAEADPSFDIDGVDAAHKIAILAGLAFGAAVDFDAVHTEGIRPVSIEDIRYAEELGYRIKLIATARLTDHGLEQRVHPTMVDLASPIAHVDGVFNAVVAEGDFVGHTVYEGRGAGAGPTASAVAADLADIASGDWRPAFGVPARALRSIERSRMADHRGPYYVRLNVTDQPGVIADIAAAFRDENVSMEAMLQRGRNPGEVVSVVLTTHDTDESSMLRALDRIARLETMADEPRMIRIEPFSEGAREA